MKLPTKTSPGSPSTDTSTAAHFARKRHHTPATIPRTRLPPGTPSTEIAAMESLRQHLSFDDKEVCIVHCGAERIFLMVYKWSLTYILLPLCWKVETCSVTSLLQTHYPIVWAIARVYMLLNKQPTCKLGNTKGLIKWAGHRSRECSVSSSAMKMAMFQANWKKVCNIIWNIYYCVTVDQNLNAGGH